MANLKEIRNRISSVSSTMQITSAMKMVSAAKLKKAQDAITTMRPYADKQTELLQSLSATLDGDIGSDYTADREVKKVLLVAISSNRGLAGAFNSNIVKSSLSLINETYKGKQVDFFTLGKKANDVLNKEQTIIENNIEIFDTSGIGYVEDLTLVLQSRNDSMLVTSGDLPLLDKEIIQKIIKNYDPEKTWTSILVTNKFLTTLGLESDYSIHYNNQKCNYTGISLINANKINSSTNLDENYTIIDDKRIAFNLNTKQDYELLGTT